MVTEVGEGHEELLSGYSFRFASWKVLEISVCVCISVRIVKKLLNCIASNSCKDQVLYFFL